MHTRLFVLVLAIGFAGACIVNAQSPTESPSPAKKHRLSKKASATASLAQEVVSPSTAESPAASPKAKRARKKAKTEAAASPVASPAASASPTKFTLGDFFKPKSSVSASPSAAPATAATGTATPAPGGGHRLVWVNIEAHVYHKEGSRFYGTTKKGKYMTEAEAAKEGDRAAGKGE